jgi:glutathione S-transferase
LARKYDLDAKTEAEKIRSDLAECQVVDLRMNLIKLVYNPHEYEKNKAELLTTIPDQMKLVSKFLGDHHFVLGNRVTYVDFILVTVLDFYISFATDCLKPFKNLEDYFQRMVSLPGVNKYMKSPGYHRLPFFGPMAAWGGQREL